jgi:hypothetical protein
LIIAAKGTPIIRRSRLFVVGETEYVPGSNPFYVLRVDFATGELSGDTDNR